MINIHPYYERAGVTLYRADCLEFLPKLKRGDADLLLTDPPYGADWYSGRRTVEFGRIAGDKNQVAALAGVAEACKVLRRFSHVYLFGQYDLSNLPLSEPVELIWDKEIISLGNLETPWGKQHEYIQFAVYEPSKANRDKGAGRLAARVRKGSVLRCQRMQSGQNKNHPTEKPVEILREMIESSSCIGQTVLDPFAGSGSTLVAAYLEGRNAIGIELEERYCEVAANRLDSLIDSLKGCQYFNQ
jgi:DNA modification methylase